MIQQAAKDFAVAELLPGVIERDEHSKFSNGAGENDGRFRFYGNDGDPKYGSGFDSIYVWHD
jgi:hypothetical protein